MEKIIIAKIKTVAGLVEKDSNKKTSVELFINFIKKNFTCKTAVHPPSAALDGTIILMESEDVYVAFTLFPKDRITPQYVQFFCNDEKQRREFMELFTKLSIIPDMYGHNAFYI